ncbi:hypothetical protein ONZ45_g14627 [Pleurotus djamor]|nr:hypothetical protein ONZ45_g14627 [Pleurotus djamor]
MKDEKDEDVKPKTEELGKSSPAPCLPSRARPALHARAAKKEEEEAPDAPKPEVKDEDKSGLLSPSGEGITRTGLNVGGGNDARIRPRHPPFWVEPPTKSQVLRSYRLQRQHRIEAGATKSSLSSPTPNLRGSSPAIYRPDAINEPPVGVAADHELAAGSATQLRGRSPAQSILGLDHDAMDVDDMNMPPLDPVSRLSSVASGPEEPRTPPATENPIVIDLTGVNDDDAISVAPEPPIVRQEEEPALLPQEDDQAGTAPLEMELNPKIKQRKTEMMVSLNTFAERYAQLGHERFPITLSAVQRDVLFDRQLLSNLYGGNKQETFPHPREEQRALHGIDDFMCLNYEMNPNAPEFPGCPGFFFTVGSKHAGEGERSPGPYRLITRFEPSKWGYLGQYQLSPNKSLTKEEWHAQKPKFRRTWVREIVKKGWGADIRFKAALRARIGRFPTDEDATAHEADRTTLSKNATEEQVFICLDAGEIFICVWGLKCVGYDEGFQLSFTNKTTWRGRVNRRSPTV